MHWAHTSRPWHCDTLRLSLVERAAVPRGSSQKELPAAAAQQRCLLASCSYRLPTKVSLIVRHSPGASRREGVLSLFVHLMTSNPTQ
jgi:hypothetical protein